MRRRGERRQLPDYDSLLDTMTNIVGVLIIVAAVVQVGVPQTVGAPPPEEVSPPPPPEITGEALELARKERESARSALAAAGRLRDEIQEFLRARQQAGERLRAELESLGSAELDPAALRAERERLETELRRQEEELKRAADERSLSERALEEAKDRARSVPTAPAGGVLTLPDPDAALAQGKTRVLYYLRCGMIVRMPLDELATISFREAKKVVPGQSLSVSAARRIEQHFDGTDVGDESFRVRVNVATRMGLGPGGWGPQFSSCAFKYILREGSPGEGDEAVAAPASRFRLSLGQLDPRRHWIKFLVYDDSFEVYLAAKQLSEQAGISSGWTAFHGGEDIEVPLISGSGGTSRRLDAPDS